MTAMETLSSQDQPVQILLAEDSDINQKIVRMMLEKQGYQVTVAADGRQAVTAWERKRYDLILMDISMPVMDGYAVARRIRELESANPRAPIIAMTGHALENIRNRCLAHGMNDWITKPLQGHQLLAVVNKWIGTGSNEKPSETAREVPKPTPLPGSPPLYLARAIEEFMGHA